MTVTDLLDPQKLAAFMGWPFQDEERQSSRYDRYGYRTYTSETIPAAEVVGEYWAAYRQQRLTEWGKSALNEHKPQTHANWIRQLVREAFGIKGRTAEEVVAKARALRPDLYSAQPAEQAA